MKRRIVLAAFCLLVACPSFAQQDNWKIVRSKTDARLREIIAATRGAMGVVALDLASGERFSINEDLVFPQGSAIKIPVMMEVYKQASEGRFKLTDLRPVGREHQVGGSGVLRELGDGTSQLSIRD
ncbi:MAG TPA: serine hydrolase, partial [Blastocatellia bacterium]|nr:serine hydrolase [Blastocatellia bacterium]